MSDETPEQSESTTVDAPPEKLPFFPRKKRFLLPIVLLLSAAVFGLGFGVLFAFTGAKRTEPYKLTMRTLQDRPEVRQHVGSPFEAGFIVLGKVDEGDGLADLMFRIEGPVGEAAVRSRVELVDGAWVIRHLDMGLGSGDDGRVITMVGDPEGLPR